MNTKTTSPILMLVTVEHEVMVVSDSEYEAKRLATKAIHDDEAGRPSLSSVIWVDDDTKIPNGWKIAIPFGDIPGEWGLGTDPTCLEIYNKLRELKIIQYFDPNQMKLPGFENIKP